MVPTYRHAFAKDKHLVDYGHRVAMCRLAAAVFGGRVQVSDVEQRLGQNSTTPSRTVTTLETLTREHPEDRFRLVVGSDILAERHKWYRWQRIEQLAPPIVIGRSGHPGGTSVKLPEISSSEVRHRLRIGDSVACFLPTGVREYLVKHRLYVDESAVE